MSLRTALGLLDGLNRVTDSITVTGGEPLLYPAEIIELILAARDQGLKVRLGTGGSWELQHEDSQQVFRALAEVGLHQLILSWDIYHEEFYPLEKAVECARNAAEAGLKVKVAMCTPAHCEGLHHQKSFEAIPVKVQRYGLVRTGRAKGLPHGHFRRYSELPDESCAPVYPLVDCEGRLFACCGPFYAGPRSHLLTLGSTGKNSAAEMLTEAAEDPLLQFLYTYGPGGLCFLLRKSGWESLHVRRRSYTHKCELCLDLTGSREVVTALRSWLSSPEGRGHLAAVYMRREHSGRDLGDKDRGPTGK